MGRSCLILGAAPCQNPEFYLQFLEQDTLVICADGGIETARRAGITPHIWVGDGDSGHVPEGTETIVLPCEKDHTDLYHAVEIALERGCTELVLGGASGGRADHWLVNVGLLESLAARKVSAMLAEPQNLCFWHSGGSMNVKQREGYRYLSIIAMDAELRGVTLRGFRYPLTGATVLRRDPIAVSNEFLVQEGIIEIQAGNALIIFSRDV